MGIINVLYAINVAVRDERILNGLTSKLKTGMEASGQVVINRFDLVFSKKEIEDKVSTREYDLLICAESFGNDNISSGSMKIWRSIDPQLKTILTPPRSRKGNMKMIKLIRDAAYYDALYAEDLSGEKIVELFLHPRTMEEAIEYYGLEKCEEIKEHVKAMSGRVSEPVVYKEEPSKEVFSESFSVEEVLEEQVTEISDVEPAEKEMETSVEEDIEFYEKQFASAPEPEIVMQEEEKDVSTNNKEEVSTENSFDFFGGGVAKQETVDAVRVRELDDYDRQEAEGTIFEDVKLANQAVQNTIDSYRPLDNETLEHIEQMGDAFDREAVEVIAKQSEQEVIAGVPAVIHERVGRENILPSRGTILRIIERHTFILEFDEEPIMRDGEYLSDYRCVVMIPGRGKGSFIDGRYKTGNITFDAYVSCVLGKVSVMMDTLDYDVVENRKFLSGKSCNIILTKI